MPDLGDLRSFDVATAPVGAGRRLAAAWTLRAWAFGSGPNRDRDDVCVYDPDGERLWFVVGHSIFELDRDGHAVRAPRRIGGTDVHIVLARGGAHAAVRVDGALVVVELASMRELFRVASPISTHGPCLSDDGAVVALGRVVWRVRDAAIVDALDAPDDVVLSLSPDGSRAFVWRDTTRPVMRRLRVREVGSHDLLVEPEARDLSTRVAWSADGRHVAWGRRGEVMYWDAEAMTGPARHTPAPIGVLRYVGDRLLVVTHSQIECVAADGVVTRAWRNALGRLLAVFPRGDRALFDTAEGPRELDLASSTLPDLAPPTLGVVTHLAWDAEARRALVLRRCGDARIWDVARWQSALVLDEERRLFARPSAADEDARTHVRFIGEHVLVCDWRNTLTLLDAAGSVIWRREIEVRPSGGAWNPGATRLEVRDGRVFFGAGWFGTVHRLADGDTDQEQSFVTIEIDLASGTVRDEERPSLAPPAEPPWEERWVLAPRGGRTEVVRNGLALPIDDALGTPTLVAPSSDGRVVLVATAAGALLRFDPV